MKYLLMGILLKIVLLMTIYTLYTNFKSKYNHQISGCVTCTEVFNIFLNDQLIDDLFMIDHRVLASSLNNIDKQQLFEDWKRHEGHHLINQVKRANVNNDRCQMSLGIFSKSLKDSEVSI